jgi:hypothetical protein
MKESIKRPKRVWLIFIWFVFGGVVNFYQIYNVATGNTVVPSGIAPPSGVLYYLEAVGSGLMAVVAALLMFSRISICRWLFLILLFTSTISIVYRTLSGEIPLEYFAQVYVGALISLGVYGLITWYSFSLLNNGYYKTHNKQTQPTPSARLF